MVCDVLGLIKARLREKQVLKFEFVLVEEKDHQSQIITVT